MMKKKSSGYTLLVFITLYMLLHFAQHHQLGFELLRFYGKDIILIPLLLIGTQIIALELNKPLRVSRSLIVTVVVYVSVVFEWFIPLINPASHSDPVDILMYSIGGLGFYIFNKRIPNKELSISSTTV